MKDNNTLCGGERSLTTMCLTLGFCRLLPLPLMCLDEFDVFNVRARGIMRHYFRWLICLPATLLRFPSAAPYLFIFVM